MPAISVKVLLNSNILLPNNLKFSSSNTSSRFTGLYVGIELLKPTGSIVNTVTDPMVFSNLVNSTIA